MSKLMSIVLASVLALLCAASFAGAWNQLLDRITTQMSAVA